MNINGTSVVLYRDEVPISLETIGIDAKGAYRIQKMEERKSPFAEYIHVYDQSFGGEETGLEYLSYSIFYSPYPFIRNIVEDELFGESAVSDNGLSSKFGVESVAISTVSGKLFIKGKDSLLTLSSLKVLNEKKLMLITSLLK